MKTIILDDEIEYVIVKELILDNTKYTLFSNIKDPKDICLRKTIIENNKKYYIGLDNEKEIEKVLIHISKNLLLEIRESQK